MMMLRHARTTRPTTARALVRWTLAATVVASGAGLAAPSTAVAATDTGGATPTAAALLPALGTLDLAAVTSGRFVTLTPTLTSLVSGVTSSTGLSQATAVFTDAAGKQWSFAMPARTIGELQAITIDRDDPLASGLTLLSAPAGSTAALPPGVYTVRTTLSGLLGGLLGGLVSATGSVSGLVLAGLPGAPTSGGLPTLSGGSLPVSWVAPVSDGGAAIERYVVQAFGADGSSIGSAVTVAGNLLTATITGLPTTLGTVVGVTVVAVNDIGNSTPLVQQVVSGGGSGGGSGVALAPTAPSVAQVTTGNGTATVVWGGGSAGTLPITGYSVTRYPGGEVRQAAAGASSLTFPGLTNGTAYTFVVRAVAGAVTSDVSAPSVPAVPSTVPGAPTAPQVSASYDSARLSWAAPADDGGAAVTGYRLTVGGRTVDTASTSAAVTGLAPSTTYAATVQAINLRGLGAPVSQQVVTPAAPPLVASIAAKAKRSGAKAALVQVDLDRASTVVVRIVRGKVVTSRTVALGDQPTWVSVPLAKKTKKLANGKPVVIEVRTLDGALVQAVRGKVRR